MAKRRKMVGGDAWLLAQRRALTAAERVLVEEYSKYYDLTCLTQESHDYVAIVRQDGRVFEARVQVELARKLVAIGARARRSYDAKLREACRPITEADLVALTKSVRAAGVNAAAEPRA